MRLIAIFSESYFYSIKRRLRADPLGLCPQAPMRGTTAPLNFPNFGALPQAPASPAGSQTNVKLLCSTRALGISSLSRVNCIASRLLTANLPFRHFSSCSSGSELIAAAFHLFACTAAHKLLFKVCSGAGQAKPPLLQALNPLQPVDLLQLVDSLQPLQLQKLAKPPDLLQPSFSSGYYLPAVF